jgi:hypothetical protein
MKLSITIARFLILIVSIIWLVFAIIVISGNHPSLPDSGLYKWILAILSFLSGAFLLVLFILLRKQNKFAFYLTIAFLFLIVMLTIMDDLGVIDFIVITITLLPIILLIKNRKWYLQKPIAS